MSEADDITAASDPIQDAIDLITASIEKILRIVIAPVSLSNLIIAELRKALALLEQAQPNKSCTKNPKDYPYQIHLACKTQDEYRAKLQCLVPFDLFADAQAQPESENVSNKPYTKEAHQQNMATLHAMVDAAEVSQPEPQADYIEEIHCARCGNTASEFIQTGWPAFTCKACVEKQPEAGEFTKELRRLAGCFWKSSNKMARMRSKAKEACDRLDAKEAENKAQAERIAQLESERDSWKAEAQRLEQALHPERTGE